MMDLELNTRTGSKMENVRVKQDLPLAGNCSGEYQGKKVPLFGARHFQVLIMAFGYGQAFSTKGILSVAIVAMTDGNTTSNPNVPVYRWTNTSVIISSILWSGIAVNLLAGYLGKRYGPKWYMICASLLNSLSLLMIPLAAQLAGSVGVIVCRLAQGLCLGFIFPLLSVVLGRWVPPEERSRMGYVGIGVLNFHNTLSTTVSGYVASSPLGWPWIFYLEGILGIMWACLFMIFGHQSPEAHPNIHPAERKFIADSLKQTSDNQGATPWRNIFSSKHFWAIVVGQIGQYFVIVMLTTEISVFLAKVMQYDIKSNGLLSSIPPVIAVCAGACISILSDMLVKHEVLAILNARRIFHLTGVTGISLCLVAMTYVPVEHRVWSIILLCLSQMFIVCAGVGGVGTNVLDVSPKYAGIISGCAQMISQFVSLFGPLVVHWVCTEQSNAAQWRIVFAISGFVAVSTGIFFVLFASGERQDWDGVSDREDVKKKSFIE